MAQTAFEPTMVAHGLQNLETGDIRRRFAMCLGLAKELLGIIARQNGTNPTYCDLQDIMDLQSELEDDDFRMNRELDCSLVSRLMYGDVSALGRATEETVDDALSLSETFLRRVTDIDGVFQSSKATCLELAADIMALVNKGPDIHPMEAELLAGLRDTLVKKFPRLKGSWKNL